MKPEISVIIPAYNGAKIVKNAIQSVLKQTFSNFELIIVNDGSTDNTLEVLERMKRQEKRIKIVDKKQNGKLLQARIDGFKSSAGNWIVYLDQDDYLHPKALETLFNGANEKVEVVVGGMRNIYDRFGFIKSKTSNVVPNHCLSTIVDFKDRSQFDFELAFWGKHSIYVSAWGKLYKKELFTNFENFEITSIHSSEDVLFNLILFQNVKQISFVGDLTVNHSYGGGTSKIDLNNIKDLNELYRVRSQMLEQEFDADKKRFADYEYMNTVYHHFLNAVIIEKWDLEKFNRELISNSKLPVFQHCLRIRHEYEGKGARFFKSIHNPELLYAEFVEIADKARFKRTIKRKIASILSKI